MIKHIKDRLAGKTPSGIRRSSKWSGVRKAFLAANPSCALCGGKAKLEVHHKVPFHVAPQFELEPDNLIVLCEAKHGGVTCHLFFGHLGNYKLYNERVAEDAASWRARILEARKEQLGHGRTSASEEAARAQEEVGHDEAGQPKPEDAPLS